jgi:hypothetical protein
MTKKANKKRTQPLPVAERFGEWLVWQPRLLRSGLAALIAIILTGALGLAVYGYLLSLPIGSLNIGTEQAANIIPILLMVLAVFGVIAYAVGWRLFIGFGGEEIFRPGRGAMIWVILGAAVLVGTVALMALYAAVAMSAG